MGFWGTEEQEHKRREYGNKDNLVEWRTYEIKFGYGKKGIKHFSREQVSPLGGPHNWNKYDIYSKYVTTDSGSMVNKRIGALQNNFMSLNLIYSVINPTEVCQQSPCRQALLKRRRKQNNVTVLKLCCCFCFLLSFFLFFVYKWESNK